MDKNESKHSEYERSRIRGITYLFLAGGAVSLFNPITLMGASVPLRASISLVTGVALISLVPLLLWAQLVNLSVLLGAIIGGVCLFSGLLITGDLYYAAMAMAIPFAVGIFASPRLSLSVLLAFSVSLFACVFLLKSGNVVPAFQPRDYSAGLLFESIVLLSIVFALVSSAIWKERLIRQAMLRESEADARSQFHCRSFEAIYENTYDAVFESSADGRITWARGQLIKDLGFEADKLLGRHQLSFVPRAQRRKVLAEMRSAPEGEDYIYSFESPVHTRSKRLHWTRISGGRFVSPDGTTKWVTAVQDIDEEISHLGRMVERSRLESLGTVCGGLAHDFNNLLTVIGIYGELVQDEEIREGILRAQRQASDVTSGLLTFARKQEFRDRVVDVDQFLSSAKRMIDRMLPSSITCRWEMKCAQARVIVDPSQLQQVLINLVNNASQAMSKVGELKISSLIRHIDAREAAIHDLAVGEYVVLSVADTGCGMDPETAMRAIEPFFTTKARGEGTGLGLATVHGVARHAGGTIMISSRPGLGTKISIVLPLQSDEAEIGEDSGQFLSVKAGDFGGKRVLLVEDRESVASATAKVLDSAGFDVTVCNTAERGWDAYATHGDFDLIIADIVLPGMSGVDLIQRIRLGAPNARAMLISAHQQDDLSIVREDPKNTCFLPKPFDSATLIAAAGDMVMPQHTAPA